MKCGVVKAKKCVTGSLRIDPSFFLSEAVVARSTLGSSPNGVLSICQCTDKVFWGNIFTRIYVRDAEHGIPYLAASDTILSNLNTGTYLSKKQAKELNYLMLQKDWIVVTCSGTVGNVTYTNANYENHIATQDLIRIIPNNEQIRRGVLYAFLASKYGYHQLTQSMYGGVVKHISPDHVNKIIIPIFTDDLQLEVDELIRETAALREKANTALQSAISYLKEVIDVPFNTTVSKTAKVSIKNIRESLTSRIDPPAFINEGVYSMEYMRYHYPFKTLEDTNSKIYRPGIFKRVYVSKGIPYIKGSEIFNTNPFKSCDNLSLTRTPFVEQMKLHEGQILITCAGSVGRVKMITKEYEDKASIGSQDIIRLESNDNLFTKEYLFAYLQLPFVQDYIQSMKYGSVIERIEPFHIESIPIVVPTKELSEQISTLIRSYMTHTYRAFKCEEQAIKLVENEIDSWTK